MCLGWERLCPVGLGRAGLAWSLVPPGSDPVWWLSLTSPQCHQPPRDAQGWLAAPGFFWNGQMRFLSNRGNFPPFRSDLVLNSFAAECCSGTGKAGVWDMALACCSPARETELGGYSQGGSSIPGGAESCMVHIRGGVRPPGSSLVYLNESRALHPGWSHAMGHWDATSGCWVALGAMGLLGMAPGRFSLQGPGLGAGVLPMPPALTVPMGAVPAGCRWSST